MRKQELKLRSDRFAEVDLRNGGTRSSRDGANRAPGHEHVTANGNLYFSDGDTSGADLAFHYKSQQHSATANGHSAGRDCDPYSENCNSHSADCDSYSADRHSSRRYGRSDSGNNAK